ncbi:hypothetical protein NPIL_47811 [Nephila pilipes]|uniref:Mos1 transposase HTH domain-containing protein n=1 Tax=Nephila pilipes TaxID=299642 RepID=A0A8X6TYT2_NEPPI|nr:hypothetical protein NPIL_47811 [Nephila pilipes]
MVAVRDKFPTRFSIQVRITLCDSFLSAKTLRRWTFISNSVKSPKKSVCVYNMCANAAENSKMDVQTSMTNIIRNGHRFRTKPLRKWKKHCRKIETLVRELFEIFPDVRESCIHKILIDYLGYAKVCERWFTKFLTGDNNLKRVEVAREYLQAYKT